MSSEGYGLWVCNPMSFTQQSDAQDSKSPHIYLKFTDTSSSEKEAAINVQSTGSDTRLVYWMNKNWTHPITKELTGLSLGFQNLSQTSTPQALDYWRTQPTLFDFSSGVVLDTGDSVETQVDQVLNNAIQNKAKAYIFGTSYGTGIHDIHCNQGSKPSYDNSTYQGGALIFGYEDGHFESVFLAFASQKKPTNDQGLPLANSETLAQLFGAPAVSGDSKDNNDAYRRKHHKKAHHHHH